MRNFIRKWVVHFVYKDKKFRHLQTISNYQAAKAYRRLRINTLQWIKSIIFMLIGVFSAAFALHSFLTPNNFIDGGAIGISLLVAGISQIPLSVLIIVVNLPFVILGYNVIGKQFAFKAAGSIATLSIVLATFHFPQITDDTLLVAVFGGFFLGVGTGFAVRGGGVIDGTEILAIYLGKKLNVTMGDVILMVNIIIFSAAAVLLSIETALYSLITYFAASKTIDFIVEGIEENISVSVVSVRSEEIRSMIVEDLHRGVTIYKGKRGVRHPDGNDDLDVVYTVITRLELNKLNTEITKIDPNAFVVMTRVKDTRGGFLKRRSLH